MFCLQSRKNDCLNGEGGSRRREAADSMQTANCSLQMQCNAKRSKHFPSPLYKNTFFLVLTFPCNSVSCPSINSKIILGLLPPELVTAFPIEGLNLHTVLQQSKGQWAIYVVRSVHFVTMKLNPRKGWRRNKCEKEVVERRMIEKLSHCQRGVDGLEYLVSVTHFENGYEKVWLFQLVSLLISCISIPNSRFLYCFLSMMQYLLL